MKYSLSIKAKTDLINIWEYTFENWSSNQADKYIEIIIGQFDEIIKNAQIGKKYDSIREKYWGLNIKSHIIFYRVLNNDKVEIIRLLHQRMDIINRLDE